MAWYGPALGLPDAAPSRFRTPRLVACTAGAVLGMVLVTLSFVPGKPLYPSGLVVVVFLLVFPLFGWAVIERAHRGRRRWNDFSGITNEDYNRMWAPFLDTLKHHKWRLLVTAGLVGGLWVIMMSSIVTIQGQPGHDQAGYYLGDHGSRIPITRAGYEAALDKQDRIFASGATLFLVVAGALTAYTPPGKTQPEGLS